ncbi:MAG: outer membrane protein assembly factor BamD [Bdellovibrionaceae bacterium]|nr:outer membrane protein assembly factor BamD [Pseudobdellovibrionaceae bacterium]
MNSILAILLFSLGLVANPSYADEPSNTPVAKAYEDALKLEKAYRYEEAIQALDSLKNKYPYSHYAKMARLKIADIHFESKSFIQAQYSYITYNELYPRDEKADYVVFQIAHSLYKQLPSTHDRDLSSARDAIKYFDQVITRFPNSVYIKDSEKYKKEIYNKLADKELYIAKFYFKYKQPLAALRRFQKFIANHPGYPQIPEALAGAAYSALRIDEDEMHKKYLAELKTKYPDYTVPKLYTKRFVWSSL